MHMPGFRRGAIPGTTERIEINMTTERLLLREMTQEDFPALCAIIQDEQTMYAYNGPMNDTEAQEWLDNQLRRYRDDGFGHWAVCLKDGNEMIGQCGLSWQNAEGKRVLEVGYLFNRAYWHQGYAIEAAHFCKCYAFGELHADEVYSIVRDNNIPSINVAIRNGMHVCGRFIKHYRDEDMPHLMFRAKRMDWPQERIV